MTSTAATAVPFWDSEQKVLWYLGHPIKMFRQPSRMQCLILQAFQEEGWPRRIDDPLPRDPGVDPSFRLHNTIKRLNADQHPQMLKFHADGTGTGITWEAIVQG